MSKTGWFPTCRSENAKNGQNWDLWINRSERVKDGQTKLLGVMFDWEILETGSYVFS